MQSSAPRQVADCGTTRPQPTRCRLTGSGQVDELLRIQSPSLRVVLRRRTRHIPAPGVDRRPSTLPLRTLTRCRTSTGPVRDGRKGEDPPRCRNDDVVPDGYQGGLLIAAAASMHPQELREPAVRMYGTADPTPVIHRMADGPGTSPGPAHRDQTGRGRDRSRPYRPMALTPCQRRWHDWPRRTPRT